MIPRLCPRYSGPLRTLVMIVLSSGIFVLASMAQQPAFIPAPENVEQLKTLSTQYEQVYKEDLAALPSRNKEDFKKLYQQRWDHIKGKFDSKEIYTVPAIQEYLDSLVAEIVKGNPVLQGKTFRCYFSRSGNPNASYIGEGIILFNMGLFYRLDNESQAAFILSHELAHFLLQHGENSMNRYVSTLNSEQVQQELRRIKGSEYRKREQVEKLVKGLTFSSRRHSRDHEGQADSMAVELVHHTRFDVSGAVTALALLDTIDADTFNTASVLERTFNSPKYPFQKKWIAKEEGLLGGHAVMKVNEGMEDSLKTHPDCQLRIRQLAPLISQYARTAPLANVVDATKFAALKYRFPYEIINYAFTSDDYTRSLYYTLELLQQKPADAYLVAHIGRLFNSLYAAQKAHTLGKVADLPSPDYQPSYNLLLQFVQNLYLENLASISYHFLARYHSQLNQYAPFKDAYSTSIQIAQQY